jgi:hypothetical protein
MDFSKLPYYVLFLFLFFVAQCLSMWGQYVTLPFPSLSIWEAYKMAIPYAWINWIIMTYTISIGHKHKLFTPTQTTLLIILTQLILILIINKFYLKKEIYRSDIIAFFIILFGFFTCYLQFFSKVFNIPISEIETSKGETQITEENNTD